MISVALHFLLVITAGGVVLVRSVTQKPDFDDTTGGTLVKGEDAPPPPSDPSQQLNQDASQAPSSLSNPAPAALTPLITQSLSPASFTVNVSSDLPPPPTQTTARTLGASNPSISQTQTFNGIPKAAAVGIANFIKGTGTPSDQIGSGVNKSRKFKFTAYLAKYQGGDWNSTVRVDNGKITMGSLPNLLFIIEKWSNDKIQADPDPVPLDLASDEIFTVKPPFIFFTGHKDFVLTDKEVDNLRKYVQLGGAIWGDSSLPGRRSRFDIAFRREMKRVVPDVDKDFEALPPNHPIFTQTYFQEVTAVPPGLNYYRENVYALKIYDEIAILYTANDYADMWQIGINEDGKYDMRRDEQDHYVAMNQGMLDRRDIYFRNLEPPSLVLTYKFGTNIILHLLTRWEDKVRNVPTGL